MQNFIDTASSDPVIAGATNLRPYFATNSMLDPANPLRLDTTEAVRNHISASRVLVPDEVSTYMASSQVLHSLDGWGYLSSAVDCLLKGETSIALHLAYYSELRGSMSFLASQGIGIFNNRHLNIDQHNVINLNPDIPQFNGDGTPKMKNGHQLTKNSFGTHVFTWDAIDHWLKSTVRPVGNNILQVFSVQGKNFEEWATNFPYSSAVLGNTVIKKWLRKWSADVHFYTDDRSARNNASYSPQRIGPPAPAHSLNDVIKKLSSFWEIMEPQGTNPFHILDTFLLRMFLQEIYGTYSHAIRTSMSLEEMVKATLSALGLNHDNSLINGLINTAPIAHSLFVESNQDSRHPITNVLNPLSIIARSTFMLRLATGLTKSNYQSAGLTHSELDFLWDRYGLENGFWHTGEYADGMEMIWDGIKEYIDEFTDFADDRSPTLSLNELYTKRDMPERMTYFSQLHRAGLWGLAY